MLSSAIMLRCFSSLLLTGLVLNLVFSGFVVATSHGKPQHATDIPPVHSPVDTSPRQVKNISGASKHIPDAQGLTSRGNHNVTTDIQNIIDQRQLDGSPRVQKRDTPSYEMSSDVFSITEAVKTLWENVRHLSAELKRHKSAMVEGFEALKRDITQRSDMIQDELHDVAQRSTEFDKTSSDRLDKIETHLRNIVNESRQSADNLVRTEASIDTDAEKLNTVLNEKLNAIHDDVLLLNKSAAVTVKALSTIETEISRGVECVQLHDLTQRFNESAEVSRAIRASIGKQNVQLAELREDIEKKLAAVETGKKSVKQSVTKAEANEANIMKTLSEIRNVKSYLRTLEKRTGYSNFSKAFFYVENITQHMNKAKKSGEENIKSDMFVIEGYTARFTVEVSLDWISVFFHFCAGSHDALLQWPFRMGYGVSIVHPTDPTKDVHERLRPRLKGACAGSFEKPRAGCNKGCGRDNLISRDSLEKDGYIYNGAITVGLTLRP